VSDWGDDGYTEPWDEAPMPAPPRRLLGLDIGGLAGDAVAAVVKASVHKQVNDIAAEAVRDALTPELMEALQAQAAHAAQAAVTEHVDADAEEAEDTADPDTDAETGPVLYYGSVDEFVREYLRHVYRRAINGRSRIWAAKWWEYDEAVIRLEALWRSWEFLRLDPSTGMSVWWRDHADPHMAVLMDPDGPFAAADANIDANHARKGEPLPYQTPPEGLFPDAQEA
jgi:hypothetical protein